MTGICFFFEPNDVDVWSGRDIDLDAWSYACSVTGDIDHVIVINTTDQNLRPFRDDFVITNELPVLNGKVTYLVCPWEGAAEHELWSFNHQTDWYVFGPAAGWKSIQGFAPSNGVFIPQANAVAMHATHVASIVLAHRFATLRGST